MTYSSVESIIESTRVRLVKAPINVAITCRILDNGYSFYSLPLWAGFLRLHALNNSCLT